MEWLRVFMFWLGNRLIEDAFSKPPLIPIWYQFSLFLAKALMWFSLSPTMGAHIFSKKLPCHTFSKKLPYPCMIFSKGLVLQASRMSSWGPDGRVLVCAQLQEDERLQLLFAAEEAAPLPPLSRGQSVWTKKGWKRRAERGKLKTPEDALLTTRSF